MGEEMQDAISQKSEAPCRVLTYAFDTNEKNDSSGKAWCFGIQNNVDFAVLKGLAVEDNLFDSVCQVAACQRSEKQHLSATEGSLKVLVMLLQRTAELFQIEKEPSLEYLLQ